MNVNTHQVITNEEVPPATAAGYTDALLAAALDCILLMDHEGRIVEFNAAAERTFGYRREDVVGREMASLLIPPDLRDAHRAGLARYLVTGEEAVLGTRLEIRAIRRTGEEFPVELTVTRLPTGGPPLFAGFVRDISDPKEDEGRLAAQYGVSRALAEAGSIAEMAAWVLAAVGGALGWRVGAFWLRDEARKEVLRCRALWNAEGVESAAFAEATRTSLFAPHVGLPGLVWERGEPVWVEDVRDLPSFPRRAAAQAEGLRSAFALPVRSGGEVAGVIEFFRRDVRPPDDELLRVAEGIGTQVGEFLQRRRAEVALRDREAELRMALDAARMGLWRWDVETDELRWSEQLESIHGFAPGAFDDRFETFLEVVHPDDRDALTSRIIAALDPAGDAFATEFRVLHPDGTVHWVAGEGSVLRDEAGHPLRMVGLGVDITERKQAEQEREALLATVAARAEREALVNRIGDGIRQALAPAEIEALAVAALGRALHADRCYLMAVDLARDAITIADDWHAEGVAPLAGQYRVSDLGVDFAALFASGETLAVPDARPESERRLSEKNADTNARAGVSAFLNVPYFEGDRIVGALGVAMAGGPREWTAEEITLAETVAGQLRSAVEAVRVRQRERTIASQLQEALIPAAPPSLPGLALRGYYRPALDEAGVGGDFFDVFPLEKGCTALVVADLSGKGLAAAQQVATVRNMLRYALYNGGSVAESINQLHHVLMEHDLLSGFATLFAGIYDHARRTLTYVNGGQEPGLIWRAASGDIEELGPTGPVLGGFEAGGYEQRTVRLSGGDVLALFTDGLTEAGPSRRELLGIAGVGDRLRRCCAADGSPGPHDPGSLVARLIAGVDDFARGGIPDDVALLVGVVAPHDAPAEPERRGAERRRAGIRPPEPGSVSAETFRLLVEGIQDYAIFLLDPEGRVATWNAGAERFKGYKAAEIIGQHFSRFYTEADVAARHPWKELEIATREGRYEEEGWRVRKDGSRFWANVVITALRDGSGALRGFAKVTRDVTERREREQERAAAENAEQQRRFLKEILLSVTQGRLILCDTASDLPPPRCAPGVDGGAPLPLTRESLKTVRDRAAAVAAACAMPKDRAQDFLTAVSECAMNAVQHAGGGTARVYGDPASGIAQSWVEDEGRGIDLSHLPRATLERGFSTGGAGFGHGFWLMLQTCDRVYLLTGQAGTTVVLEQERTPRRPSWV